MEQQKNEELVALVKELKERNDFLTKQNAELQTKLCRYEHYGSPEYFGTEVERLKDELREYDYDYDQAVYDDVWSWVKEKLDNDELPHFTKDKLKEWLEERLYTDDDVTGNGSGSYTFNRYTAEKYICHNIGYIFDKIKEIGYIVDEKSVLDAEELDVTMRCALLNEAIDKVVEFEIPEEFWEMPTIDDDEEE